MPDFLCNRYHSLNLFNRIAGNFRNVIIFISSLYVLIVLKFNINLFCLLIRLLFTIKYSLIASYFIMIFFNLSLCIIHSAYKQIILFLGCFKCMHAIRQSNVILYSLLGAKESIQVMNKISRWEPAMRHFIMKLIASTHTF